jgi:hypothetical protein
MIIRFNDFLNEDISDDIRKRLSDRINKTIDNIILKYPKIIKEKPKTKEESKIKSEEPLPPKKVSVDDDEEKAPRMKPKKSLFGDKRLDDSFYALTEMGLREDVIKSFLLDIDLQPDDTVKGIVKFGIKYFFGGK